jgi:hypothetical protein
MVQGRGRKDVVVIEPDPQRRPALIESAAERIWKQQRINVVFAIDIGEDGKPVVVSEVMIDLKIVLISIECLRSNGQKIVCQVSIGWRRKEWKNILGYFAESLRRNSIVGERIA